MKKIWILSEDANLFERLDPYGWLSFLSCPNVFAIGYVLDEDEDIQTDGGLVVVSATRKELTIHWLAVGRRAEGLGLGSMLLKTVFEIAEVSSIRRVSTVIAPAYYGDPFYSGAEIFFEERFFTEKKEMMGFWQGTLAGLMKEKVFADDCAKLSKVEALSDFSPRDRESILSQLVNLDGHVSFLDIEEEKDAFDPELSFIIREDGQTWGALMVKKLSESLLPVYFYADSMPEARALAITAAKRAVALYGKDMPVDIILTGRSANSIEENEEKELTIGFATKLLPESSRGGFILSAKTDDYKNFISDSFKNI